MILYNVTVSIDPGVREEWLDWMRSTHIPDVMATGHFKESRISRVHGEEEGGETYAITYLCYSEERYLIYQQEHALRLQQEHTARFSGKFAAFRTLLSVIEEFNQE